jgi:hypothetical protein
MGGSQQGSQDSPGGNKVWNVCAAYNLNLTICEDLRKRHIKAGYDQTNHRCVGFPHSKTLTATNH